MKLKTLLISCAIPIGLWLVATFTQGSWGEPVPQNELGLVVDAITFNNGANAYMKAADDQAALKLLPNAKGSQVDATKAKKVEIPIDKNHLHVVRGRRLPFGYSMNPSVCVFNFDLGLQEFTYSSKRSYESPTPNQIEADCLGGHVSFDVNLQMEIDRSLPDEELALGLFHFIHDQKLQGQRGQHHLLATWSEQMLHTVVGTLMKGFISTKQLQDTIEDKEEISKSLLDALNKRYNQYGIRFYTAAIVSAIRPPANQQQQIDQLVMREYQLAAQKLREEGLMPVKAQMQLVDKNGRQAIQDEHNRGQSEAINVIAAANKDRRKTFGDLIGAENYVKIETLLKMKTSLVAGGNTTVVVLPDSLQYAPGLDKLPRPTAAAGDDHIYGIKASDRTREAAPDADGAAGQKRRAH